MVNKLTDQLDEMRDELRRREPANLQLIAGEDRVPGEIGTSLPTQGMPALLNVEEASRFLRISRNATYNLIAEKRLAAIRLGRRIVIPSAAIERLIAEAMGEQKRNQAVGEEGSR